MFPGLTLSDLPSDIQLKINVLINKYLESNSSREQDQIEDEIIAYLLPYQFYWKEFTYWQKEFQRIGHFPYLWASLRKENSSPGFHALLNTISQLGYKTRLLLVKSGSFYRSTDRIVDRNTLQLQSTLNTHEFNSAIKELDMQQLISMDATTAEYLNGLTIESLVKIAKLSSNKNQLIQLILEDQKLLRQIPKDLIKIRVPKLDATGKTALTYHLQKLDLLRHTLLTTKKSLAKKEELLDQGLFVVEIVGHSPCPICISKQGQILRINSVTALLPPFHPGCTCNFEVTDQQIEVKVQESMVESLQTEKRGCMSYFLPKYMLTGLVDTQKKG